MKPAYCKTTTFQASFFNRNVKPWNFICNLAPHDKFSSLSSFKKFLRATYFTLLDTTYDIMIDIPCTWFLSRNCPFILTHYVRTRENYFQNRYRNLHNTTTTVKWVGNSRRANISFITVFEHYVYKRSHCF